MFDTTYAFVVDLIDRYSHINKVPAEALKMRKNADLMAILLGTVFLTGSRLIIHLLENLKAGDEFEIDRKAFLNALGTAQAKVAEEMKEEWFVRKVILTAKTFRPEIR